jgi:cell division protein FtsZ
MVRSSNEALQLTWQDAVRENRKPGRCRIVVVGVGGAGNNTVTRLMEMGVKGAESV